MGKPGSGRPAVSEVTGSEVVGSVKASGKRGWELLLSASLSQVWSAAAEEEEGSRER